MKQEKKFSKIIRNMNLKKNSRGFFKFGNLILRGKNAD